MPGRPRGRRRVALEDVRSRPPGEVGLIGHSGAGKSTWPSSSPALDPARAWFGTAGATSPSPGVVRSQIGVVLQTPYWSAAQWRDIAYGLEDASREEVVDAASRANAHDFIAECPGLRHHARRAGGQLSAGSARTHRPSLHPRGTADQGRADPGSTPVPEQG